MRLTITNSLYQNGTLIKNTTINANGNSDSLKKTWADGAILFANISGVSGSNTPTLTFTIQSSPNNVDWADHNAGTGRTSAGFYLQTESIIGPYVRVKWEVSGTNPSFTGVELKLSTKGGQ